MSEINNTQKVLVIGAGLMGTGIAHAYALAGHPVALVDQSQEALDRSISNIRDILSGGVRLNKVSQADAIGKSSVLVNESPGFATSRMSALAGNEAMYMLAEGVASAEDIDTALRLGFSHPMGPLELGDLTGWDTHRTIPGQPRHSTGIEQCDM